MSLTLQFIFTNSRLNWHAIVLFICVHFFLNNFTFTLAIDFYTDFFKKTLIKYVFKHFHLYFKYLEIATLITLSFKRELTR